MKASLEEEATEHGQTLSEYLRALIEQRHEETVDASEYQRVQDEYHRARDEYEQLQAECDRLERRVDTLTDAREERGELIAYVEDERELQRQERARRQANIVARAKGWVFGWSASE